MNAANKRIVFRLLINYVCEEQVTCVSFHGPSGVIANNFIYKKFHHDMKKRGGGRIANG